LTASEGSARLVAQSRNGALGAWNDDVSRILARGGISRTVSATNFATARACRARIEVSIHVSGGLRTTATASVTQR